MKNILRVTSVLLALGVLIVPAISAEQALAAAAPQSAGGGNGLKISPVRTDVTINPGAAQIVDVYVQNVTGETATLQAQVNDFVADTNETGTPKLILNANDFAPTHSLKRLVQPIANVTVKPNETKDVKVRIVVPQGEAGGGYYGAIRFAPASADTSKNLFLSASVGSLVLVKVPGDIKESLILKSFDIRHETGQKDAKGENVESIGRFFTSAKSLNSVIRFQNAGNIQLAPFGKLTLKRSGKVLQQVEVNSTSPPGNVLPDSIRRFDVPLNKVTSFGKFTLEGDFGYGSSGQLLSGRTTFYVVPLTLIIIIIVLILLLLGLIFGLPRVLRAYNRRVISDANARAKASKKGASQRRR